MRSKFLLIKRPSRIIFALCLCAMSAVVTGSALDRQQFTYAWPFAPMDSMKPRGGTTQGADVTLQREPDQLWFYIQESGLEKIEKDRRAIRAMSGAYRASFDFLELVGFEKNYQPKAPYQSWGTEYVYIVTDDPFFISLQHVLVMSFVNPDSRAILRAISDSPTTTLRLSSSWTQPVGVIVCRFTPTNKS